MGRTSLFLTSFFIISQAYNLIHCEEEKDNVKEVSASPMPQSPEDFQKMFSTFFTSTDPKASSRAFYKFVEDGRKAWNTNTLNSGLKTLILYKPADEKKETETENESEKEYEPPLQAKVFAFYAKVYGCQHSKVYKAFLSDYYKGTTEIPDNSTEDNKWLKDIAENANSSVTIEEDNVTQEQIEEKMGGLDKSKLQTLDDGESHMPLPAKIFIHFIKGIGCANANEPKYQIFKDKFKERIAKAAGGKPKTDKFYIAKADDIIEDIKAEED